MKHENAEKIEQLCINLLWPMAHARSKKLAYNNLLSFIIISL